MEVRKAVSSKEWDSFLEKKGGVFLQSFGWGEFKKKYQRVWRFELREDGGVLGIAQVFEEKGPFYNYLYIPYGPVAEKIEERELILEEIKKELKNEFSFMKIEPQETVSVGFNSFYRIQPQKTIILDLQKDILKEFSKNTRYNVRLANRRGVSVKEEKDVEAFHNLLKKTKERKSFSTYPKEYFEEMLKQEECLLFLARHNKKVVAGNVIYFFGNTAACLHSTSDYSARKLKAANLLRFEVMNFAKEKGYNYFNSWGIDEKRFPGVTEFKKGFGGEEITYPPGKEIPIKKVKYFIYRVASFIKEKRR